MSKALQTVVYGFIIFLVVIIGFFVKPSVKVSARGVFLPAKHVVKSATPKRVDMMTRLPANYTRLGEVSVEMHFTNHMTPRVVQAVEAKAKKIAAQIGANGLYVQESGYTQPGSTNANLLVFVLKAQAIKYYPSASYGHADAASAAIN